MASSAPTAAQQTEPAVTTYTGLLNTLAGWAMIDPEVEAIAPWFRINYGPISDQMMDRTTLDYRIAALPPEPPGVPQGAIVLNGDPIPIWGDPTGWVLPGSPAIAVVSDGELQRANLPMALTTGIVNNGQGVQVQDSSNVPVPGSPGVAVVASHSLSKVTMNPPVPPATQAMINNGAAVVVVDAAGAPVTGSPGAAEVANRVLTDVKLTV
jgi:hypothetical protein